MHLRFSFMCSLSSLSLWPCSSSPGVGIFGAGASEVGAKAFTAFNTSKFISVSSGEIPAEAGGGGGGGVESWVFLGIALGAAFLVAAH